MVAVIHAAQGRLAVVELRGVVTEGHTGEKALHAGVVALEVDLVAVDVVIALQIRRATVDQTGDDRGLTESHRTDAHIVHLDVDQMRRVAPVRDPLMHIHAFTSSKFMIDPEPSEFFESRA
jgi:hypothetical protein